MAGSVNETVLYAASDHDQQTDIATLDSATAPGSYSIRILADLTETADLPAINLASGVSLTIDGSSLFGSGGTLILAGGQAIDIINSGGTVLSQGGCRPSPSRPWRMVPYQMTRQYCWREP